LKLGKKGIINLIEAIVVIGILFVAFAILFPGISFKSGWNDAMLILTSRDLILTMDRLNILYKNSFDSSSLQDFVDTSIPINRSSLLSWSMIEGTVPNSIFVACNCTDQQRQNLNSWMSGMKVNGRNVTITFEKSSLDKIVPSHTLLIWGNTELDPYLPQLLNYIRSGGGIIEINDFSDYSQTGTVQQTIFDLVYTGGKSFNTKADADHFSRKPINSTDIIYGPYKYFFHVPMPLKVLDYPSSASFPIESWMDRPRCYTYMGHGTFLLNDTAYDFWACNSTTVYFDTDNNGSADTAVMTGDSFRINGYNFTLQYIELPFQIGVSFGFNYQFRDFLIDATSVPGSCPSGNGWNPYYPVQVSTADSDIGKILLNASFRQNQIIDLPVVIINNTGGRTAWIADFTNSLNGTCTGIASVSDDEKLLLTSLIFWVSSKQPFFVSTVITKSAFITKYVNTQNLDTYEVYSFDFGLGSPFVS
jgi:hypothetical protein